MKSIYNRLFNIILAFEFLLLANVENSYASDVRFWDFTSGFKHVNEVVDCNYWNAGSKGRYSLAIPLEDQELPSRNNVPLTGLEGIYFTTESGANYGVSSNYFFQHYNFIVRIPDCKKNDEVIIDFSGAGGEATVVSSNLLQNFTMPSSISNQCEKSKMSSLVKEDGELILNMDCNKGFRLYSITIRGVESSDNTDEINNMVPVSVNPPDGSVLQELKSVLIDFGMKTYCGLLTSPTATLYRLENGNETKVAVSNGAEGNGIISHTQYKFTFSKPITENGTYIFSIKEGVITDGDFYNSDGLFGHANKELRFTYIIDINPTPITLAPSFKINRQSNQIGLDVPEGSAYFRKWTGLNGDGPGEFEPYEKYFDVTGHMYVEAFALAKGKSASDTIQTYVDWVKASPLTYEYKNSRLKFFSSTPGAEIRYVFDQNIIESNSYLIYDEASAGIDMSQHSFVSAYAAADGYENSDIIQVNKSDHTSPNPTFVPIKDINKVEIKTSEGTIYYRYYKLNKDAGEYVRYENPVAVDGNSCIDAYVSVEGKDDSEVVTYYVDWVKASPLTYVYKNSRLMFFSSTPGAEIRYVFDQNIIESNSYLIYDEASAGIDMSQHSFVSAYAAADGYENSNIIQVNKSDHTSPNPTLVPIKDINKVEIKTSEGTIYYRYYKLNKDAGEYVKYENPITVDGNSYIDAYVSVEGKDDSEVVTYYVDWVKAPVPVCTYTENRVKLNSELGWSGIYYSLDADITDANRKALSETEATDGIDMTDANVLYAYNTADGFSRSDIIKFDKRDLNLAAPMISFKNGNIVIEHGDLGATAHYAIYTDAGLTSGNALNSGSGEVPVTISGAEFYNCTVMAYVTKQGWNTSDTATLGHSDIPQVSESNLIVSISIEGDGVIRYTLDGSLPTEHSELYHGEFKLTNDVILRAASFDGNLIPGVTDAISLYYRKCDLPVNKGYDGRYLHIGVEPGDRVYYSFGNANPISSGSVLDEAGRSEYLIDMNGLTTIRIVRDRDNYDPSDEMTFISEYYANGTDVFTTAPHQIHSAFGWTSDYSSFERLNVHGSLNNKSKDDNYDYRWLRTNLTALKHLDLCDVSDAIMPDNALDSIDLVSVVMPAAMTEIGSNVFGENNTTLCAIELPAPRVVPTNLLKGVKNPNLIGFVAEKRFANNQRNELRNVVVTGGMTADTIMLSHGYPFYSPKNFVAKKISFSREFSKQTSILGNEGFGCGWESMSVPFNVSTIKNGDKLIEPFAVENRQGKPFWLYEASGGGWEKTSQIKANVPYLLSMPNHPWYDYDSNIKGTVTFSGENADVLASVDDDIAESFSEGVIHVNYATVGASDDIFALNESEYMLEGLSIGAGGIFIKNERDVLPFECYVTSHSTARYVKIFGGSNGVDELPGVGFHVWTEGNTLFVRSDIDISLPIFDTVGQLIRIVKVKAGETASESGLTPGIYLIANKKLIIKN